MSCASLANWRLDSHLWNGLEPNRYFYWEERRQLENLENNNMECPKCGAPLDLQNINIVNSTTVNPYIQISTINYGAGQYGMDVYNTRKVNETTIETSGGISGLSVIKCDSCGSNFFLSELQDQQKYNNLRKILGLADEVQKLRKETEEKLEEAKQEELKKTLEKNYNDILEEDEE